MNAPQLPAPVNTGDLSEMSDSCPLPRLTQAPDTRLKSWLLCCAATEAIVSSLKATHALGSMLPF